MRSAAKRFFIFAVLGLAACAPVRRPGAPAAKPVAAVPTGPARQIFIFIPRADDAAASWLKPLQRDPNLRMTIALSPRFHRFDKEPLLKSQFLDLQKSGRLELALQLPNAPFLPLLINTDAAKGALPASGRLPVPPFAYPDDAAQIIAQSQAEFSRVWKTAPKGIVLPYGAASADLFHLLNRLGFQWAAAALGAPSWEGAYRSGSLLVLDATPSAESPRFSVLVWDERRAGSPAASAQTLNDWPKNLEKRKLAPCLPGDPSLPVQELGKASSWGGRTWTTPDWSPWIGSPAKNAAWTWLRKTREDLEKYKNSGTASVKRLDMAFQEMYTAENANFFSGPSEDLEHEFKATLSAVYRLMSQAPPDDLFSAQAPIPASAVKPSSSAVVWETLMEGRGRLLFTDPADDDHGDGRLSDPLGAKAVPGAYDLRQLEVDVSSDTLDFAVTLGALPGLFLGGPKVPGPMIDIYMDLNGQPGIGTLTLLPGRGAVVASADAWEYALCLFSDKAQLYRTRSNENYDLVQTLPLAFDANRARVSVPRALLRGAPQRWGYQVLVMSYDPQSTGQDPRPRIAPTAQGAYPAPVYDLLDPPDLPQAQLLGDLSAGRRSDIPFVRYGK